jgi:outer membrane protein assembly factor BamB
MRLPIVAFTLAAFSIPEARAVDWPQWLGPNRDGSTSEIVKPWKKSLQVVWRKPVGDGYSSPVVSGGKVFVLARVGDEDEEELIAFNTKTGKELWRKGYKRKAVDTDCGGYGPRSTPCVSGKQIFTQGISGVISSFDGDTGKLQWQVNTHEDFDARFLRFGVSSSPVVFGDLLIAQVGARDASLVAFDKKTGKVAWKKRSDAAGYASPALFGKNNDYEVVFLTGTGLVSLQPKNGELLWEHPVKDVLGLRAMTPTRVGDVVLTGTMFGSLGIRVPTKNVDKSKSATAWKSAALTCYLSTPLAAGERFYVVTNTLLPSRTATLRCVNAKTGKELWNKPNVGKYHASLIRMGDDKLLMLEEAGALVLLDVNDKGCKELARSKVCGTTLALPALADGLIYVRDSKEIICLKPEK